MPYYVSYRVVTVQEDEDGVEAEGTGPVMRQYVPMSMVAEQPDIEAQVVAEAIAALWAWERRYSKFAKYLGLKPVVKLVRQALDKTR